MSRRIALLAGLVALGGLAAPSTAGDSPPTVAAVRVGHLFTGSGEAGPGTVLIAEGRITAVGKDLPLPAGARVLDLPGAWATPGWIDGASTAGVSGRDSEETREITPTVRPLRAFDPRAEDVRRGLEAGVTALFLEPGGRNVVGGIASVVKTAAGPGGARPDVVREEAALKIAFGNDPSWGNFPARGIPWSIYARRPTTRMGVLAVLRDAWILGKDAGTNSPDADLASMARAAAGEIPVRALARHVEDIRTALRVGAELGFRPVLEGVAEGYVAAERLATAKVPCVVGPLVFPQGGFGVEGTEPAMDNAGALHRAGVLVALTAGDQPRRLREQAALAVRYGLPREAALRAVTSAAAEVCGVADRLGTLAPGRDADLVIFDGDPLEPASRVLHVIVGGRRVAGAVEVGQ